MNVTQIHEQKKTTAVSLLRWPAPYRAALAICNDLDCTSIDDFVEMHRFLNTTRPTTLGDGLGLPIGDSYWMFTVRPDHDRGFAYFADLDGTRSPVAPRMREWMQAGLLDVLHTYGNFSQHGGFRREHAERAAEELCRWGIHPQVWVNHGDCHNFQNIHGRLGGGQDTFAGGRPFRYGADGVAVRNLEYHLDITHQLGVRFLWVNDLTQDPGQDRPLPAREHLFDRNAIKSRGWLRRDVAALGRAWLRSNGDDGDRGEYDNRLLRLYRLDPGPFYSFPRFGRFGPDCMRHLPILLSDDHLDRLVSSGGASVLFIHLGKRPDRASPVFDAAAVSALQATASRYHARDLYVESTSRLLRYVAIRDHVRYSATRRDGKAVLDVERVDDPVLGDFVPSADDLAGLCFDVRSRTTPLARIGGADVRVKTSQIATDRYIVQFPIRRLDPGDLLD